MVFALLISTWKHRVENMSMIQQIFFTLENSSEKLITDYLHCVCNFFCRPVWSLLLNKSRLQHLKNPFLFSLLISLWKMGFEIWPLFSKHSSPWKTHVKHSSQITYTVCANFLQPVWSLLLHKSRCNLLKSLFLFYRNRNKWLCTYKRFLMLDIFQLGFMTR